MSRKHWFWIAAWVVLVVVTGFLAFGHGRSSYYGAGPGWGHMGGWGPMGNWGEGYRGDGGPGWSGMGPGMMGRGSYGPGGYGPGRGAGQGWGMMGSYGQGMPVPGYGMGMSGGFYGTMPWALPDLTPEQEQKIAQMHNDPQSRQRALMQQVWAAQASLSRLYAADKRDWAAIRAAGLALHDLQRQHIEAAIELQQKTDALLTENQRKALTRARRSQGWMGEQ